MSSHKALRHTWIASPIRDYLIPPFLLFTIEKKEQQNNEDSRVGKSGELTENENIQFKTIILHNNSKLEKFSKNIKINERNFNNKTLINFSNLKLSKLPCNFGFKGFKLKQECPKNISCRNNDSSFL